MPAIALPRRMFAGGRITFHRALELGETAERVGTIASVKEKTGASGALVFVTVRYEISGSGGLAIEEEQDIVYREAAVPGAKEAPKDPPFVLEPGTTVKHINVDPVLLFRFSALTSNGHRIHYDRTYAMNVEHYPGLVVHGPLQAMMLVDLVREKIGKPVKRFTFAARRPLFDTTPFDCAVHAEDGGADLMTLDPDGQVCMRASVEFA